MSYLDQSEIASNVTMYERLAQCAVEQDVPEPEAWVQAHRREWGAAPGWDAAWAYAQASHPDDRNYDPGRDEAVITDGMILAQVQSMQQ
jgi:hypothetical protein